VKLRDVLRAEHIIVPLDVKTAREATELLAQRLVASGAIGDGPRFQSALERAWPQAVVAAGEHTLLPHVRTDAVAQIAVAVGVAPQPVRWDKEPNRAARIVVLVVAPPREAARYLQVVGAFARGLNEPETVRALFAATTPADVVAIATLGDVELPQQLTVRDVMTSHVLTLSPDRTLAEAAHVMLEHDVRALPVVNETGGFIGMITHRELLKYLIPSFVQRSKTGELRAVSKAEAARGADPRTMTVKDAMARSVLCLNEEQSLQDVAALMQQKDIDRFPVVREGIVVGFLTRADLVRRLIAL
jgi:CBS domain-containing protein